MTYLKLIPAILALSITSAFAQSPQITSVLLDDGTPMDGAIVIKGIQRTVTVSGNSDLKQVQFSCIDSLSACRLDCTQPFTRSWTPSAVGMHSETFYPFWSAPPTCSLSIQGPAVTVHFTTVNP